MTCNSGQPCDCSSRSEPPSHSKGSFVLQTSLEPQNYPSVSPLTLSWVRVVFLFAQSVALQSHSPRASDAHRKLVGGLTSREPQGPLWLCHWHRALGPPVLASCVAAAFPFCSVFMAARFAPFFFGLGIDKRKLTRPFLCRLLRKTRLSYLRIRSVLQRHQANHIQPLLLQVGWQFPCPSSIACAICWCDTECLLESTKLDPHRWIEKLYWRSWIVAFFFSACSLAMSDSTLQWPASATFPRTPFLFGDPVRGVRWYSCVCAGLTTRFSSIRFATDNTLISVYTSTCQLIYDLIHEIASLLFLAARPPFPPEWR